MCIRDRGGEAGEQELNPSIRHQTLPPVDITSLSFGGHFVRRLSPPLGEQELIHSINHQLLHQPFHPAANRRTRTLTSTMKLFDQPSNLSINRPSRSPRTSINNQTLPSSTIKPLHEPSFSSTSHQSSPFDRQIIVSKRSRQIIKLFAVKTVISNHQTTPSTLSSTT